MLPPEVPTHLLLATAAVYSIVLFIQAVLLCYGRQSKESIWFLLLLIIILSYNCVALVKYNGTDALQILSKEALMHAVVFATLMYLAFYFYKVYHIIELRFYATYGLLLFLATPFLLFFVLPCYLPGDVYRCRQVSIVVPFFYTLLFAFAAIRAFILRHRYVHYALTQGEWKTIIRAGIAVVCWALIPLMILLDKPQLEHVLANTCFLLLAVNFIWSMKSRSESTLALLNGGSLEITRFAAEAESLLSVIDDQLHHMKPNKEAEQGNDTLGVLRENLKKLALRVQQLKKAADTFDYESATDISTVLESQIAFFEGKARKKHVGIKYQIIPGVRLAGPQPDLHRIIYSVFKNAIRHATRGESIHITLSRTNATNVMLSVTDRGIPLTINITSSSSSTSTPLQNVGIEKDHISLPEIVVTGTPEKGANMEESINSEQDMIRGVFETLRQEPKSAREPQREQQFNNAFDRHCWRCGLTPREIEILHALNQGNSHKKIADLFFISKKTVDTHVGNIFRKVREAFQQPVTSRVELLNILEIRSSTPEIDAAGKKNQAIR